MPVTSSRVDCISSCLMRGCSPVSASTGSSSSSFPASWRSSLVSLSISWTSHSTPSVAPREGFHSIAMPGPFVLCSVSDSAGPILAPDIAQRVADLTESGIGPQCVPERVQHVLVTFRGLFERGKAARHRLFGSLVPEPGQPGRLRRLDGRVDAQRLITLLAVGDIFVHA